VSRIERRPLYLDGVAGPVFSMWHVAAGAPVTGRAGILLPPWGWHEVASYRARREWADDLAAAGVPTLRLDLPGTGDSAGSAGDPDRLGAWVDAVVAAAAWVRAQPGVERLGVIGLGLGGLVALRATDGGVAIDDLVLWSVPDRGRRFVREQRAFAGMQGARFSLDGAVEPRVLPVGWLEVNGFVLSAETIAALDASAVAGLALGGIGRALVLDADGIPADTGLETALRAAGVDVTLAAGPGWSAMTGHPERSDTPTEVLGRVGTWLSAEVTAVSPRAVEPDPVASATPRPAADSALLPTAHGVVRETPLWIESATGPLFAILAEPVDRAPAPAAAVFLNAGAVRRIGPNRIWVETARRWAAIGVPTVRLDLHAIGDTDGATEPYRDVANFYVRETAADEIRAALDALEARGLGPRLLLAGLCAGGFWAFQGADRDPRVTAALLLNPGALVWHTDLVRSRDARRLRRLLQPAWWSRLLRGKVRRARIKAVSTAALQTALQRPTVERSPIAILDSLAERDVAIELAFSDDEWVEAELRRDGVLAQVDRWPLLVQHRLPSRDHTLRPIIAQVGASAVLDAGLARELARAGVDVDPLLVPTPPRTTDDESARATATAASAEAGWSLRPRDVDVAGSPAPTPAETTEPAEQAEPAEAVAG
jgi:alpha-beta hydrolase superfamily lysophospholipase